MRSQGIEGRIGRVGLTTALLLCAALPLTACAAISYAGVSFAPGAADAELQVLARRAHAGVKHAQLELGIRFEKGIGVPTNLGRAKILYQRAASSEPEMQHVYAPAIGGKGKGGITVVQRRRGQSGLNEAVLRLRALEARR